jgi:hypothetical protein
VAVAETTLPAGTWRFVAIYNLAEVGRRWRLDLEGIGGDGVVYDYLHRRVISEPKGELAPEGGAYLVFAPRVGGVAFLGLVDKFIAVPSGKCWVEPVKKGVRATFRVPPGGEPLVGVCSQGRLEVEAEGAEIRGCSEERGLYLIRVCPLSGEWSLTLRGR